MEGRGGHYYPVRLENPLNVTFLGRNLRKSEKVWANNFDSDDPGQMISVLFKKDKEKLYKIVNCCFRRHPPPHPTAQARRIVVRADCLLCLKTL